MKAIEINHLSKTYRGKKGTPVRALTNLSLTVEPGEVFGFLGPNGAGKSTTIKILTGQIRASDGGACIFGTPVGDTAARQRLGYLPENPSFYDFLTGREYLQFVGQVYGLGGSQLKASIAEMLALLDLEKAANRPVRGYSKGMAQRLGLAQALLHDPDLFILDEPMSGLDPLGRALVKEIIRDLRKRGKTVFFSTHITTDVEAVCDRLGVIAGGELRVVDKVESILQKGIEGYALQVVGEGGGVSEIQVKKEALKEKMRQILDAGGSIERIEPSRQNLEDFFLEIVGQGRVGNDAELSEFRQVD